jgi:NADH dehydrogenase [ubiquinone] 1 alpha subcomplex assembly factor 5
MSEGAPVPRIFDETRRAMRRERAARTFAAHDFLHAAMADEMLERLGDVTRSFTNALVIGCPNERIASALRMLGMAVTCADPAPSLAARAGGIMICEDAPPFGPGAFDLILACGTLDTVNDLPGALIACNRLLVPDGLMLASFIGAGSLPRLRAALLAGESARPAQRIHPQVDVRAFGDLLNRAGFAMPVADVQSLDVRYGSIFALLADLRGMGAAQCLASAPPPLSRTALARAAETFAGMADPDGRTTERFVLVHGSGWGPAPGQAMPAARGSAMVSLAQVLKDRS